MTTATDIFVVDVPGAFETFFSGTSVAQGQEYSSDPDTERGARELHDAWHRSTRLRRGKGHTDRLVLPSIEAAVVLAEYAETCLTVNFGGDMEWAEVRAARKVLERIETATAGRVKYNGFYVEVDGTKWT